MTLDEAIVHEKELAEENYLQGMLCHANPDDEELDGCIKRGKYHEWVAKWLENYKRLSSETEQDIYERAYKDGYDKGSSDGNFFGYNKAIDDFVEKYKFCDNRTIRCHRALNCADCIAEQLKGGDCDI